MSTLRTLHDAFEELEHRADTASASSPDAVATGRSTHRRLLAPAAAAAAVVLAAGGIAAFQYAKSGGSAERPASHNLSAGGSTQPSRPPATTRFQPPTTGTELAATTRTILAGIATIEVTDTGTPVTVSLPRESPAKGKVTIRTPHGLKTVPAIQSDVPSNTEPNGSAIVGTLTASGVTGGFDLNVFTASPGSKARCDGDGDDCTVRTLADGSSLAVGIWHDREVPGGITYQVEVVRPDGADILLHLSTEHSPKGESSVTASHVPLSQDQMIDFVRSDQW